MLLRESVESIESEPCCVEHKYTALWKLDYLF